MAGRMKKTYLLFGHSGAAGAYCKCALWTLILWIRNDLHRPCIKSLHDTLMITIRAHNTLIADSYRFSDSTPEKLLLVDRKLCLPDGLRVESRLPWDLLRTKMAYMRLYFYKYCILRGWDDQ